MPLSEETIQEFMAIYKAEFNEELSFDDAQQMASELLNFYKTILN